MQYNLSVQLQHAALLKTQHYYNRSELTVLDGNQVTLFNNAVAHFTLYLWGHSMSKSPETTDQVSMIYQKKHSNATNPLFQLEVSQNQTTISSLQVKKY